MLLWDTFFAAGQDKLASGAYVKAEELLRSALSEAEGFADDDPRLLETRLALAEVHQSQGRGEQANLYLDAAQQQVRSAPGLPLELVSKVFSSKLRQAELDGVPAAAKVALAADLVALWRDSGSEFAQHLVEGLLALADLERAAGDERAARHSLEEALETALELHGPNSGETADLLSRLAASHLATGEYAGAERYARRSLVTLQAILGEADSKLAQPLAFLACVLERQQRFDEALPLVEQAAGLEGEKQPEYQLEYVASLLRADRAEAALSVLHQVDRERLSVTTLSRFDLARLRVYRGVGDLEAVRGEAQRLAASEEAGSAARVEALVELAELTAGEGTERISGYLDTICELADETVDDDGELLTRIADLARLLDRKEIAEQFYDRAISARSRHLDPGDPASVRVMYELGKVQERRRHLVDAATSWEKALEALRRHGGKVDTPVAERQLRFRLVWRLAEVYVRQRRWERAEQAWRSLVRSSAPGSPEAVRGRLGLAQVHLEQDQFRKALETLSADGGVEITEEQFGRDMFDAEFLLRLASLSEIRQFEDARIALDQRFDFRGAPHLTSVRELAAAVVFAHCTGDDELLTEVSEELSARRPSDVEEQLLLARFYALLARHNSRFMGQRERQVLGLGPMEALNKAVDWATEANGHPDLRVAELLEEKASAAVVHAAWEEAEEATRASLEMRKVLQGERSATLLPSLQRLGELQLGRGQLEHAVPSFQQALALAEMHLRPEDSGVRELLRSLLEAHRRRGEFEEARGYMLRLLELYDRFEDLRSDEKLDDLLRAIRFLLGDERDHRILLSDYLDEATELATSRGEIAALSLAFCLGQKARLVVRDQPDQAVGLLRRQATTLEEREEAREFVADQILLGKLLLYRGQPQSVLTLLQELEAVHPFDQARLEIQIGYQLLRAQSELMLERFPETARCLDFLEDLQRADRLPNDSLRGEILALQLSVYVSRPDLVGDEAAARAYARLDQVVEAIDRSRTVGLHEEREQWSWELARLRFETARLSPEVAQERLLDHTHRVRESASRCPLALSDALALLAWQEQKTGQLEEALGHLDAALKLAEDAGDVESLGRARMLRGFAENSEALGRYDLALSAYRESIGDLRTHLGSRHRDLVPLYLGLARLTWSEGDPLAAESSLLQALSIVDDEFSQVAPDLITQTMVDLARLYSAEGRQGEALELWKRVEVEYQTREELLPTIWLKSFLQVQIESDREAEALTFFLDGLPFRLGQEHDEILIGLYADWVELTAASPFPRIAADRAELLLEVRELVSAGLSPQPEGEEAILWSRALVAFAKLYLSDLTSDLAAAKQDLAEAFELRARADGPESLLVGEVLRLRAQLARTEGDLVEAESSLTSALNIMESQVGAETWEVAEVLLALAEVYFQKQKYSPTEAVLRRTVELCRQLLTDNDRRWIEVYHLQGRLSLEQGRPAVAAESLERALGLSRAHSETPSRSLLIAAGKASLLTERPELALELFSRAEETFPSDSSRWDTEMEEVALSLGELFLGQQRFAEAEQRLSSVVTLQEARFGFGDARLARVYRALAVAATGTGEFDTAEERLEVALAFQEENLFVPLDLFTPMLDLAQALREEGREDEAVGLLSQNLERCREAERPEAVARLTELLARSHESRGDHRGAEEAWRETIDAWENALVTASAEGRTRYLQELLGPLSALARLLSSGRRYTEAEELTKQRLKVTEMLDADERDVADVLFDLAELHRVQGLYREADELHQRVLATKASELGRTHPEVARSVRALGQIYLGEGKTEQAVSYLERALEHQVQALGESHPDVAETMFALGDTFMAKEDFRQAEDRYRQALELLEQHYGPSDIRTAKAWTALAGLYEKRQQWSRAQPLLGRAVSSVEAVLGPSHLEVADLLLRTAEVYLVSGAWEEVSGPLERALEIRSDKLGEDHPAVARALLLKGQLSLATGDVVGARRLFGKADQIISAYHGAESAERLPFRLALAGALRELDELEQSHSHLQTLLTAEFWQTHKNRELAMADIHEELAKLELARSALPVAENFAKQALDVRSRMLGAQSEGVAAAMEVLAQIHRQDGRTITASALAERSLEARSTPDSTSEGRATSVLGKARALTLLARLELDQATHAKAAEFANEALNLRRELLGEDHPEVAASLHMLGQIALDERRLEKAETYFEQALEKWEKFYGGSHTNVFLAVTSLAHLFAHQGRLTLAEQYHQRNLEALEDRYGAENPILTETLLGLGRLCRSQGNLVAAESHLKRAAELQTAIYGDSDPRVAGVLHALALVYQDQRNFLAAEALLKKAHDIRETTSSEMTPELAESNLALARLYRASGKVPESEPYLKKVLDWRSRRYGDNHPEVAAILREMADVFGDQKQYLKAQALVRRAMDIYAVALGPRSMELIGPLRQLARLLEASGDSEEAETHKQLARELMGSG